MLGIGIAYVVEEEVPIGRSVGMYIHKLHEFVCHTQLVTWRHAVTCRTWRPLLGRGPCLRFAFGTSESPSP